MRSVSLSNVPAFRELTPDVSALIKVHAFDGRYLRKASATAAQQIVEAGLGSMVNGYIRLRQVANRESSAISAVKLNGLKPTDQANKDNIRGVWAFRTEVIA